MVAFLFYITPLAASIIETFDLENFKIELLALNDQSLVIFDVDETLITPKDPFFRGTPNPSTHCQAILQNELGIIWTGHYVYENTYASGTFVPRVKLSYINDTPFRNRHLHASFVDSDCNFTVRGLHFRRNLGAASLGLTYYNCDDSMSMTLRYDGQFCSHYYNQAANIALDIKF